MKRTSLWETLTFALGVLIVGASTVCLACHEPRCHDFLSESLPQKTYTNYNMKTNEESANPINGVAPPLKTSLPYSLGNAQGRHGYCWGNFWAYNLLDLYGTPIGPVNFDEEGVLTSLHTYKNIYITGSDFDIDMNWYGVNYYGGLYRIDQFSGNMSFIADTIPDCDSLVIDTTTNTWYVSSNNGLYSIDIETGQTTPIGLYEIDTWMISIMIDSSGHMYGYDVVTQGNSTLYSIDKFTGRATAIGDMGHTFCYGQEGKFDRWTNTLYLAAFDLNMYQAYLATCDPKTAHVTIINGFTPSLVQIDGLAINWVMDPRGVGVDKIKAPVTGDAQVFIPEITIRNYGWYDITNVTVTMNIAKHQYTDYINEDFNETYFPPAGWNNLSPTDHWVQSPDSYAGGTSPEAVLWDYNNIGGNGGLQTSFINTIAATALTLSFRSSIEWSGGPGNCTIEVTRNGGLTWQDISPWPNPIPFSQPAWHYQINISADNSTQTSIRFLYSGKNTSLHYWAIDDIHLYQLIQIPEYNHTTIVDIPAWNKRNITFPEWIPSDLNTSEDITVEYRVNASTYSSGYNPLTHYKQKTIFLHFGYLGKPKKAFLFGSYANYSDHEGYITIDAVNLHLLSLNPFQWLHYMNGQKTVFIKETAKILLFPRRLIGIADVII